MNPDAKHPSPHGWYEQRGKTRPRNGDAGRRDRPSGPPPSLLKLCQGVSGPQLVRPTLMRWIEMGADVDRTDVNGLTALMFIAQGGHLDLVRYLVGRGLRVNTADIRGFTALAWAAWNGHREVVRYLKSRGATIHVPAALFAAARVGRVSTLQLLQQVGARMRCSGPTPKEAAGGDGQRPVGEASLLTHAAAAGQLTVVQFLMQAPHATSIQDRLRAMDAAVQAGHYRVASYLETGRDRPWLHPLRRLGWILQRRARVSG